MSSVVLDLQNEVTKSKCDIVSVLRRAHLIATKLSLAEFNQWVVNELNGYKSQAEAPEYRSIVGQLRAFNPYYGWIPVMLADAELEKKICNPKLINSISEILSFCEESGSSLIVSIPTEVQKTLNEICDTPLPMQMAVHVSKTAAVDIIEKVKNTLLEWTLELEAKGILGEGMSFNDKEKEIAKTIPQQINNYYGAANVINGSPENLQANAGETVTAYFNYEDAKKAVADIEDSIKSSDELSEDDKAEALELLSEINKKIEGNKKGAVIKAALTGLKDFVISTGAALTATLIQAKIQGLF